jgi:hypothetical protein
MDNDVNISVIGTWKPFSIMDWIKWAALAFLEIRPSTLNACWKASWQNALNVKILLGHQTLLIKCVQK